MTSTEQRSSMSLPQRTARTASAHWRGVSRARAGAFNAKKACAAMVSAGSLRARSPTAAAMAKRHQPLVWRRWLWLRDVASAARACVSLRLLEDRCLSGEASRLVIMARSLGVSGSKRGKAAECNGHSPTAADRDGETPGAHVVAAGALLLSRLHFS
jgi:hypothetical protein